MKKYQLNIQVYSLQGHFALLKIKNNKNHYTQMFWMHLSSLKKTVQFKLMFIELLCTNLPAESDIFISPINSRNLFNAQGEYD